jgi:hypothetical protein
VIEVVINSGAVIFDVLNFWPIRRLLVHRSKITIHARHSNLWRAEPIMKPIQFRPIAWARR